MFSKVINILFSLVLLVALVACTPVEKKQEVKNVIFMIGDGMGLAHTYSAMMSADTPLAFERAQYIGLSKTYSANNRVTDSAASGTAMATGHKTYNGAIGVDADKNVVENIVEKVQKKGFATGIVVTKDITDATPASFMAHQPNRKMAEEIACDIVNSGVDLFIGGGRDRFDARKDSVNLIDELKEKGYAVAFDMNAINAVESGKLAGLLAPGNMVSALEGRGNYLPEATEKALSILKNNNPEGFFLMVEGSQIDSGAHGNNTNMVIAETIDFSKAVEKAFDFADKNPGTLVVVTADHETGGMTIPSQDEDFTQAESGIKCLFSTGGHTAVVVPVYAYGTGADNFTTIMENTDLPKKMIALLGLEW